MQYPDKNALLQSVNTYMTAFSAQEAAQARLQAKQRSEPDADGFVTVTRGGRTDPSRPGAAQALLTKQKNRQDGLEDFYRFQTREKKKARAGELIRKFEEDKEKIRKMKEKRGRFKVCFATSRELTDSTLMLLSPNKPTQNNVRLHFRCGNARYRHTTSLRLRSSYGPPT